MSEPRKINSQTEKIAFRSVYGSPERQTAVVRRNRTIEETHNQFSRIFQNYGVNPGGSNSDFSRLSSAYARTMGALEATGRGDYITRGDTVLISRRNNRR